MKKRKISPEQAAKLLAKYRAEDPVLHYKPAPTFERANQCVSRFICIDSPNQVGKTAWMQYTLAALLRGKHPYRQSIGPLSILLVVPSRAQAAKVWGDRLLKKCELNGEIGKYPWIPRREMLPGAAGITWAVSPVGKYPGKITMRDGSQVIIILSGDPNSWKRLEGMTFDVVMRDEVAGNENLGDEIQPRLIRSYSRALSGERAWGGIVIWAATETKFNEEWMKYKERAETGVTDYALFKPKPEEANAYVSMEAREAMRDSMSEKSFQIRGEGSAAAGDIILIYHKQWNDQRHLLKELYQIQPDDNLWISWDPGVEHPTGILIAAVSRDNPRQIKVIQFYLHRRETIKFDVECIDHFILGRKLAGFVYDYAAKNRSKTGAPSVRDCMITAMEEKGYDPILGYIAADKRHTEGINCVREYLDPNPYDKNEEPLLVLNKITPQNGIGQARAELISYRGKESTQFSGAGGVVKKDDEFPDCVRYLCRCFPAWSPALQCGHPTKEDRTQAPPTKIVTDPKSLSIAEQRALLSRKMAKRNRLSVAKEFNWRYRIVQG